MKVVSVELHKDEGEFPLFLKGTPTILGEETKKYEGWYYIIIEGYKTYAPIEFIDGGKLTVDYNPTELSGVVGEEFELLQISHEWAKVRNKEGKEGWYPLAKLISI